MVKFFGFEHLFNTTWLMRSFFYNYLCKIMLLNETQHYHMLIIHHGYCYNNNFFRSLEGRVRSWHGGIEATVCGGATKGAGGATTTRPPTPEGLHNNIQNFTHQSRSSSTMKFHSEAGRIILKRSNSHIHRHKSWTNNHDHNKLKRNLGMMHHGIYGWVWWSTGFDLSWLAVMC